MLWRRWSVSRVALRAVTGQFVGRQSALRAVTGWGPRDYWFPNIRSLPGAALMFVCVLYPYVYLLCRAAFSQQTANAYLAARQRR